MGNELQDSMKKKELTTNTTSFWIAPLIVGSCLAIGYGISQRVIIVSANWKPLNGGVFELQKPVPGISLSMLKDLSLRKSDYLGLRSNHSQLFKALSQRSETEIRIVLGNLQSFATPFNEDSSEPITRSLKIFGNSNENALGNFNNEKFEGLLNQLPKP